MGRDPQPVLLGPLCHKIGSGATPRGGEQVYTASGVALIRSQNVHNNLFERNGLAFIGEQHAQQLAGVLVEAGDVLLNITGDSVAQVCQAPADVLPARVNQHVAIIRPNPDRLHSAYLRYFLVSQEMQEHMLGIASGGGTRNALTKGMIERFVMNYRPLAEQRAIAGVLVALDDKIAANRRLGRTLEALGRAVFRSWFVDFDPVTARAAGRRPVGMTDDLAKLFPTTFADSPLGPIPQGWRMADLPDVIEINPTRRLTAGTVAAYLDMGNMPTDSARVLGWVDRAAGSGMRFQNGDTLVARITPCLENGKTAFVDFLTDGEIGWGSTEYIVLRSKSPLPPEFAYLLARTDEFRSHAIANMTGSSGRQRVPAECLRSLQVAVPSVEVAEAFGRWVRPLFAGIKARAEQSRTLAALRDALLPRLLSGELRVRTAGRVVETAA